MGDLRRSIGDAPRREGLKHAGKRGYEAGQDFACGMLDRGATRGVEGAEPASSCRTQQCSCRGSSWPPCTRPAASMPTCRRSPAGPRSLPDASLVTMTRNYHAYNAPCGPSGRPCPAPPAARQTAREDWPTARLKARRFHRPPAAAAAEPARIFLRLRVTSSRRASALRRLRSAAAPLPPSALGGSASAKLAATWPR
jgi:hypothetical protein